MPTKEEIRETLLQQMNDPTLPSPMFDEYNRRLSLLDE